jgi:hypothetical protein
MPGNIFGIVFNAFFLVTEVSGVHVMYVAQGSRICSMNCVYLRDLWSSDLCEGAEEKAIRPNLA